MALHRSLSLLLRNPLSGSRNILSAWKRFESMSADSIQTRNPYEELKVKIDPNSSKDNPMKVNAYGDERTIACVCDDLHFMTLKKGPSVQCKCGHWFQLVDADKFWIKHQDA